MYKDSNNNNNNIKLNHAQIKWKHLPKIGLLLSPFKIIGELGGVLFHSEHGSQPSALRVGARQHCHFLPPQIEIWYF